MGDISDLAASCIRCGFCLESCPTFVVTGSETESPRGRIYLARSLDEGILPWTSETRAPLDSCVGCRSCETACPSGVKYGEILELARAKSIENVGESRAKRLLLEGMTRPWMLRLQLAISSFFGVKHLPPLLARRLSAEQQVATLPKLPDRPDYPELDESKCQRVKGTVALLEGCAMGVLFPHVHEATERLLRRVGYRTVRIKGCCGALHGHAGYRKRATDLRDRVTEQLDEGLVLLSNSAGCGSWLKGRSSQVLDVTEFLTTAGLGDLLKSAPGLDLSVAYHDACHLWHGQGVTGEPRALLSAIPGIKLVPIEEPNLCCGSGGVYNLLQPGSAHRLGSRKWKNILATGANVVVTGNPGCQTWIDQFASSANGNVQVLHTMCLLESAFSGSLDP